MTNAHDFTLRLQELLSRERAAMADLLVAVADFDRRSLWLDLGYASLFDYLHRELGLSKASSSTSRSGRRRRSPRRSGRTRLPRAGRS